MKIKISELKSLIKESAQKEIKRLKLLEEKERIIQELNELGEEICGNDMFEENGWPKKVEHGKFTEYCHKAGFENGAGISCAKHAMQSDDSSVRGMASFYMNTVKPEGKDASALEEEIMNETKPSTGLSAEKKSEVVKTAKAGKDIGHKGKGFKDVAAKAAKEYGSKESGEKVAGAAMWKNIKR